MYFVVVFHDVDRHCAGNGEFEKMKGGKNEKKIFLNSLMLAFLCGCKSTDLHNIGGADTAVRNDIAELQERQADARENAIRIEERSRDIADGIGELIEQSQSGAGTDEELEKLINEIREGNATGTSDNREATTEDSRDERSVSQSED